MKWLACIESTFRWGKINATVGGMNMINKQVLVREVILAINFN